MKNLLKTEESIMKNKMGDSCWLYGVLLNGKSKWNNEQVSPLTDGMGVSLKTSLKEILQVWKILWCVLRKDRAGQWKQWICWNVEWVVPAS